MIPFAIIALFTSDLLEAIRYQASNGEQATLNLFFNGMRLEICVEIRTAMTI